MNGLHVRDGGRPGLRERRERDNAAFHYGCEGKKRHPSKSVALAIRKRLLNVSATLDEYYDAEFQEVYKCHCGTWHLGHKPGWKEGWMPQWA